MSPPPKLSRRVVAIGGFAVAGAAVVAGAAYELPRLFKRRARGEYADLVNRLDDPDQAATVGRQILRQMDLGPSVDAGAATDNMIRQMAADIRTWLKHKSLKDLVADDIAQHKLAEVDGWVLPTTLAGLCALAAQPD